MLAFEEKIKELRFKSDKLLKNKSDTNLLLDIIQELYADDEELICCSVEVLQEIFCKLMERGDLCGTSNAEVAVALNAEEKYKQWLAEHYTDVTNQLFVLLENGNSKMQMACISSLSTLAETEKKRVNSSKLLKEILQRLLSKDRKMQHPISNCQLISSPLVLKFAVNILKQKEVPTEMFLWNTYFLLTSIQVPVPTLEGKEEKGQEILRKYFSMAWLQFLRHKLPLALYKRILVVLYEKTLAQLCNPLLMTDFLTESYNIGGSLSLLALNGLFFLMQKFNLEYPDFYQKLYSLLTEEMFYVKYRARFFFLTDLFLTSTHLPAYLVAAFAKKLSRLALVAPVDALAIIILLIGNLLVRHPTLRVLIHREGEDLPSDPYLPSEELANCNALESSLWELKSLQNHWHPDIASKACFINKRLPTVEWDLSNLLEQGYTELLEKAYSFEIKDDIPIAY